MGKLLDELKSQLDSEKSDEAKECLSLYDILLEETGSVWTSHWNVLTKCVFIGKYPNTKRIYKLNKLGKLIVKGYNCK